MKVIEVGKLAKKPKVLLSKNRYIHKPIVNCAFASTTFFFFFNILKVYGNFALNRSSSTIFPAAFAPFTSLCHILVILMVSQTFSLLLCVLQWSVTSGLGVTLVTVWGRRGWGRPVNLIMLCVFCRHHWLQFPHLCPRASLLPDTQYWN